MILFLLKAWSVTCNVTSYIINMFTRYPLQFLLVVVCVYAFWQKTRYDAATHELEALKANIVQQAKDRAEQNKRKEDAVTTQFKSLIENHNAELAKYKLDADREAKNLKDNLNAIQDIINRTRDGYNFRLQATGNETAGLRSLSSTTEGTTESRTDTNAVNSLVRACQVTTISYNTLRKAWDDACLIHGCK